MTTRRIRIQFDYVIELDTPVDSVPNLNRSVEDLILLGIASPILEQFGFANLLPGARLTMRLDRRRDAQLHGSSSATHRIQGRELEYLGTPKLLRRRITKTKNSTYPDR